MWGPLRPVKGRMAVRARVAKPVRKATSVNGLSSSKPSLINRKEDPQIAAVPANAQKALVLPMQRNLPGVSHFLPRA